MRNRRLIFIGMVLIFWVLIIATGLVYCQKSDPDSDIFEEILWASCAKFESWDTESSIYITSEIRTISASASSLMLIKCDKQIDQWLYRITSNCREITISGHEIVVMVGPESLSINGELYTTPDGVPFEKVVEYFAAKYKYFSPVR